jgi:hypothetical protein
MKFVLKRAEIIMGFDCSKFNPTTYVRLLLDEK